MKTKMSRIKVGDRVSLKLNNNVIYGTVSAIYIFDEAIAVVNFDNCDCMKCKLSELSLYEKPKKETEKKITDKDFDKAVDKVMNKIANDETKGVSESSKVFLLYVACMVASMLFDILFSDKD